MTTILVTGAAGFIGVPTVRFLLDHGFDVVAFDNFATGSARALESVARRPTSSAAAHRPELRVVRGDLTAVDDVKGVMQQAEPWGVVHLAALHFIPYCVDHPSATVAVNVLGLQYLLDAIDDQVVRRFVFASTADVYRPSWQAHHESDVAEPVNVYGSSKLFGERLLALWRRGGVRTEPVTARLFNVYGPGETNPHLIPEICRQLQRGSVLRLGNVLPRRDYVYVDDVAETLGCLLVSELVDVTVNVGTGRAWSAAELVTLASRLLGRQLTVEIDPAKLRPADRPHLQADPSLLWSQLPSLARVPLERGLRRLLVAEGLLPRAMSGQVA